MVELQDSAEDTRKMECNFKGKLALAHKECAIKWFGIKGNRTCEVCKQDVMNLLVMLQEDSPTYRVRQDVFVLVIVSLLAYFYFLERLLFANVDCSYEMSDEELNTKISLCDALIVRSGTNVSREVFESSGGRLKVVGRAGVGIDNVDLSTATEHGCLVVNAPTANTVAAAEHGIALLTAMVRNVAQADASIKAGQGLQIFFLDVSQDDGCNSVQNYENQRARLMNFT
ncbi:D-isomer specific 2-hydroxyacid dehydrogenase [Artemisia annua]|uniref:D-isomer specific 2-hydroxyacid dehydrogenase n=1 Tax=Artemisia annua TaxID=35608 RepID=A0A2U1N2W0_ARTAN|nr:D-isomer specific 2-hydroxyacid dehydrogenase [Artemisia annua]